MFLSLETLTSIIRTGWPILVQLTDTVNSVIILLSQMTLLRWLTFLIRSQTVILVVLPFWIYLFLVMLVFVLQQLSLHWEILISVSIESPSSSQQDSLFHHIAYHYSRLIGMVFMIIWEMFHGRISKLAASAAASELCEWVQVGIDVYIPHIRSSLIHLHSFQLLVLLP